MNYANSNPIDRLFSVFEPVDYNRLGRVAAQDNGFRIDIEENDDEYRLHADLPGIRKEDTKIQVEDNVLTIRAEFDRKPDDKSRRLRSERMNGRYARSFRLSHDVDADAIGAKMKDGVLVLSLPKVADSKRSITIK